MMGVWHEICQRGADIKVKMWLSQLCEKLGIGNWGTYWAFNDPFPAQDQEG